MATYDRLTLAAWTVMHEDLDLDMFLSNLQQNKDDVRRILGQIREPQSRDDKTLLDALAISVAADMTHRKSICEKLAYLDQIDQPLASFIRSVYLERQAARKLARERYTPGSDVDQISMATNGILVLVDASLSFSENGATGTSIERDAGANQTNHSPATPDTAGHQSGSSLRNLSSEEKTNDEGRSDSSSAALTTGGECTGKEVLQSNTAIPDILATEEIISNEEKATTDLQARALCEAIDAAEDDGTSVMA